MSEEEQTWNPLRALPSVEAVLSSPELAEALATYRREVVLRQVRASLATWRGALLKRQEMGRPPLEQLDPGHVAKSAALRLRLLEGRQLHPVVNATGILIHTNLGRSVLGARAREALLRAAGGYCDLELEPLRGRRSHRDRPLEPLVCALTGAEAATVVNNCAAAVYLILWTLARRKEVITSRGELVEIGGNFRVPDVVRASGCKLIEVGTTNRTRLADYAEALTPRTALLLKTHQSNYRVRGFTEEASIAELAGLARERGLPLVFDAGSGLLAAVGTGPAPSAAVLNPETGGGRGRPRPVDSVVSSGRADRAGPVPTDEPLIPAAIADGANLVCFSGDKLLGGPQAGIICGDRALVDRLRKSPLWRALRVDKLTVAALGATLAEQLRRPERRGGGGMDLLYSQLAPEDQRAKAQHLLQTLEAAVPDWTYELVELDGAFGGGSLPDEAVPGWGVALTAQYLDGDALHTVMRISESPSVLGLLHRGRYCLHVAALLPGDAELIAAEARRVRQRDREQTPEEREHWKQVQAMAREWKFGS
jgi:L-seryl-tRNA(Ser) seleniumtransferase